MDHSEPKLSELYSRALKAKERADSMPRSDSRQDLYISARRMFEQTMDLVGALALFSDNETIDDVATADLKYLLIPAYLANITISGECGPNRLETFTRAEDLILKFLRQVLNYGLGGEEIERIIKCDNVEPRIPESSLESAMKSRNDKIERFRRMKLLESKLDELNRRIKSGQEVDDETSREYYISLIQKWVDDSVETLEREVRPALFFEKNRPANSSQSRPSPSKVPLGPHHSKTITIVKDELQKKVFGLGYPSKPTVTVDEFITKKINDGDLAFHAQKEVYANSLQRYAEQPDLIREQEELSDIEHEEKEESDDKKELDRKRQWDEFKDENPRGSGNRHNMG